jgi:uncharacterized protein (TIGR03437 family)
MVRAAAILLVLGSLSFSQPRNHVGEYALILQDPPVAQRSHSRAELLGAAAKTQAAKIRSAQNAVVAELQRRGVRAGRTSQILANAVFVHTDEKTAGGLAGIPGVARVQYLPPIRLDLNTALGLENVSAAWSAVGGVGVAGAGMRIGIIDTGIDQNHPGFQDSSLTPPAGFPRGDSNFTNNKVIVARSYVSTLAQEFDSPDDLTARDRIGHGTAIAMIAAGAQNTGPQATIQGVAPKAFLGNYKVFGSPGVNTYTSGDFSAVALALADALSDGMDVVTLSVNEGDPAQYGPLDSSVADCGGACDVRVQVVENAVQNGLVVVTSAGNSNGTGLHAVTLSSVHTPGTAPSAITVGASTNAHAIYQTVRVSGAGSIDALMGDGPHLSAPLSAPAVDVTQLGNDGLACAALPAGSLAGKIALVEAGGTCVYSDKINFSQNAGAVGVLIYQASGIATITGVLGAQNTGIPAAMIGNPDGTTLKGYLDSNGGATATLDPAPAIASATQNQVAAFSSRGPSIGNFSNPPVNTLKPELVAVGDGIYTAAQKYDPNGDAYNATGYTGVSGTSYAVPMVAGAIALVKQKNPNLKTPAQLKSAVVNTATQDVLDFDGSVARVNAVGAGKLSVGDAVNVAATLDPATVSFGAPAAGSLPMKLTVNVTNVSGSAETLNFAVQPRDTSSASVAVSPTALTLQPNASSSITITLSGTIPAAGSYEGFIVATGSGPTLRLPYEYLVGSGVPYDIYPILDESFFAGAGDTGWVDGFRLLDQYGVPVVNYAVLFGATGGGSIALGDAQTAAYGVAAAQVDMSAQPGYQDFTATAGSLTYNFESYARAYPAIVPNGVVDDASGGFAQRGLAPGSYISIYGSNLADAAQAFQTPYLPVALSAVSISFDGDGLSYPGYLTYVSPGQINTQIPWEFQGHSSVGLTVWASGLPASTYELPLAAVSPGIFTIGGTAAAIDYNSGVIVSSAAPAKRGDIVELFVNGLGAVTGTPASGQPSSTTQLSNTAAIPTVTIGGVAAQVMFSGLTPGSIGLYQVNVVVPQNASAGNAPVIVSIGGVSSAAANLPVQ